MIPLGKKTPSLSLIDVDMTSYRLDKGSFNGYIFAFICNHCPYVINIKEKMSQILNDALKKNFCVFAINSNDSDKYPLDSVQMMKNDIIEYNYKFPYLVDKDQDVAKEFQALCTPEFYIFNNKKWVVILAVVVVAPTPTPIKILDIKRVIKFSDKENDIKQSIAKHGLQY